MRRNLPMITIVGLALALLAALGFSSRSVLAQLPYSAPATAPRAGGAPGWSLPNGAITATPTATATPCGPSAYRILIAYADLSGPPTTLRTQILAEPGVVAVDLFDAASGTPTLAQLLPYTLVVPFSNNTYQNAMGMGDVLADYADAGGIVVGLNFNWYGPPYGLDGRWMTGGYTPFNSGSALFSNSTLGAYNAGHPLMQGVTTLNGYFRHSVTLTGGAVQVAAWADNTPLIAYKTNNGHTGVGINNYSGENPNMWSGQFGRVIVNAARWLAPSGCATGTPTNTPAGPSPTVTRTPAGASPTPTPCGPSAYRILIAYADLSGPPTTLRTQMLAEPGVVAVDLFDAASGTPTLAQLLPYTLVVPFSNNTYLSAIGMGDVLADYADAGGIVVGLNFNWFGPPYGLDGRWMTGGYTPFNSGGLLFSNSTLGAYNAGHPLMQGVTTLNGYFRHSVTLTGGAVQVAAWADNAPLIAYKTNNGHTGIGINNYSGENPNMWSGQFGRVIVNAARWLAPSGCATGTPTSTPAGPSPTPTVTRTPAGVSPTPTCSGPPTPGAWVLKTPYPLSVYGVGLATDGTYAYAFGGNTIGGAQHAEAYRYDPVANSWTALASMTAGADYLFHADIGGNGKIYVIGGNTNGTANRIYDIATNTWTSGAPVPVAVYDQGHAAANGKIYVIGGIVGGVAASTVYAYDVAANTWSPLAPLPQAEFDMAAGVINGKIYVAGGSTGSNQITNLYIYDIAANSWTAGPPMGLAVNFPGGTVVGGQLWVIGGGNPFSSRPGAGPPAAAPASFANTQIYDPISNTWANGPALNQARSFADAVTLNVAGGQMALIVGGYNSTLGTSLSSVEANTVTGSCTTPTATATPPSSSTPTATNTATPTQTRTTVPSATVTNTPVPPTGTSTNTPTNTPVPPTGTITATPTATVCALYFADVPSNDPFYTYIRCLTCRALITGYDCGGPGEPCNPQSQPYFRSNNPATRGQVAKILSNAAGYADVYPTTRQTFADTPNTNTFWAYIERIAARGYISGYTCGGPGEPCDPQNRPYFRSGNSVTRGQLSKMTAQTAGLTGTPTGQTFTDVPANHPFYLWIERLAGIGAINGYTCGGPGEPCDPQKRPYFRPYSDVTRGQTTKIIANAFFPNCQTPARP